MTAEAPISWTGVAVFAVTYVLLSARKLSWLEMDRPAIALFGAVACVVLSVLTPEQAIEAIDRKTLALLFGVMGMGAFLTLDHFAEGIDAAIERYAHTPGRLLAGIVWGAGLLAALITNDAVCLLAAPIVVRAVQRHDLPPLPFSLALATAANTGSVATLVGNPQNMLCGLLGRLSFGDYLAVAAPLAIACLALNHALLVVVFRRDLRAARIQRRDVRAPVLNPRTTLTLVTIAATGVAATLGADMTWAAITGLVALMLLHRRDTRHVWENIDWSLLLFFAGLFIVVEGFIRSGAPAFFFAHYPLAGPHHGIADWMRTGGLFLLGSNVVSNVPFILVVKDQVAALPNPTLGWELLAVASTFAGNLTLLGSVANLIVAEGTREVGGIGFFEHLRIGLPLAVLTTVAGTLWLVVWHAG